MKFTDYLRDLHAEDYSGFDDDMSDDFNDWLADRDIEDMVDFGESYGAQLLNNK